MTDYRIEAVIWMWPTNSYSANKNLIHFYLIKKWSRYTPQKRFGWDEV
jgi:hypothetical protein